METIYRGFAKGNSLSCQKIVVGKEQIVGHWQEGVYFQNIRRTPCPMDDYLKDEDIAHLIIYNGMADWNLPSQICTTEVIANTVCKRIDNIVINQRHPFEKDIVSFKYVNKEIEYTGLGYLVYDHDDNLIVVAGDVKIPYKHVEKVNLVGNIFDNADMLAHLGITTNGLYGRIIHSYWDNSNGLTHYIVIQDNRGETWKFGGLDLEKNPCSKWIQALMDTFGTKEISDSGLKGMTVFLAIDECKPVALMYTGCNGMKIIDTRNFYDNE